MTPEPEDPLDSKLLERLRRLKERPAVPPFLEDKLVAALKQRKLLRSPGRASITRFRIAALGAACAACLAFGAFLGARRVHRVAPPAGPRFVLLLDNVRDSGQSDPSTEARRVAEYSDWAQQQRAAGRILLGEKLQDRSILLTSPASDPLTVARDESISGLFIVVAENVDRAIAVARTCPHLRHGGRITIRSVAEVP